MRSARAILAVGLIAAAASLEAANVYTVERPEATYGITNPVLRTSAYVLYPDTATWEIALPNGRYWVTTTCGDVAYVTGPHQVVIEGQVAIDNKVTAINQFEVDWNRQIDLTDGALTVVVGGAAGYHAQAQRRTAINSIVITSVEPSSQTFAPVDIDFCKDPLLGGVGPAAGFEGDYGYIYGDRGNGFTYGWTSDLSSRMLDKPGTSAQENRTIIKTVAGNTETWEMSVPNGMYFVSLAVGDETGNNPAHRVTVEDNLFIPNENLSAMEYYTISNEIVYVYDGKLTVKIGGGTEGATSSSTCLCWIKVVNERPAAWDFPLRINFQPGYSKPLRGYKIENGALYTGGITGRGWGMMDEVRLTKECASINPLEEKNLQQVFNTFIATNPSETKAWQLDNLTPNGNYYVYLAVGDPRYYNTHRVAVEGTAVINDVATTASVPYYLVNGHLANVGGDGVLNVAIGGNPNTSPPTGNTCFDYIVVDKGDTPFVPWPQEGGKYVIRVNFQPSGVSPEPGYAVDDGSPFCPVRKCGWSPAVFTRYRDVTHNKLVDSFAVTRPGETNVWDVAVPANRAYTVFASAGHTLPGYNYHQRVAVESPSNYIINGTDTDNPITGSCTVSAGSTSDGFIRLYVGDRKSVV